MLISQFYQLYITLSRHELHINRNSFDMDSNDLLQIVWLMRMLKH